MPAEPDRLTAPSARGLGRQLAWRYAFSRGGAIATIGWLAMAGLALSIAVLVIVVSVVNGFERELKDRLLGQLPHVSLFGRSPVARDAALEARLVDYPGVRSVAPFVQGPGMLVAGSEGTGELAAVLVTGIDPGQGEVVERLQPFLLPPELPVSALADQRFGVFLGSAVARDVGAVVGDLVTLVLPQVSVTPAGLIPRQKRLKVLGLLDSGSELDTRTAYLNLPDAARLFRIGKRVHGYELRLEDLFVAERLGFELTQELASEGFFARSWMRSYGNLYQAIIIQKQTMFILLSFLIAVAAFNLVSGLFMVGKQRSGDIAILATLGVPRRTFVAAFGLLGLLLGGVGILLGLLAGVGIASVLPGLFESLSSRFGLELMTEYFVRYLPVEVRAGDLVGIALVSLLLAGISAIYPALSLARLRPVEVLAHE